MPTENNIDQYNLAYIAGLFDGDGHVSLRQRNEGGYVGHVGIAQVEREILETVTEQTGGLGRTYTESRAIGRTIYRWRTSPREAQAFLELTFPYLKAKRVPAALLLDYFYKIEAIPGRQDTGQRRSLGSTYSSAIINVNKVPHDEPFPVDDSSLNWPYLAGLFDAEGNICVPKSTKGDYYNNPRLSMGMTDQRVMEWVEGFTKIGRVRLSHPPVHQKRNARPMYLWLVPSPEMKRFLRLITPHLRIKRRRAELARELMQGSLSERAVIAQEVRRLNHENEKLRHQYA